MNFQLRFFPLHKLINLFAFIQLGKLRNHSLQCVNLHTPHKKKRGHNCCPIYISLFWGYLLQLCGFSFDLLESNSLRYMPKTKNTDYSAILKIATL